MLYKGYRNTYDFKKFETMCGFWDVIRNGIITMNIANEEQKQLPKLIRKFKSRPKPSKLNTKKEKEDKINSAMTLLTGKNGF